MKKLINRPEAVVEEMVEGLAAVFSGLHRLPGHTVLIRSDLPAAEHRPVAVLSGGGSGHEPAHAGFVGRGMLAGAVAGEVFTSPSPDAVLETVRATAGPRGALLIVKNYTGDRLNFGLAAEMARAEGVPVEIVLVADDVALAGSVENAGRRGLAGTILIHKTAGAVAEAGGTLAEVADAARTAAGLVRTMGVALTPCTVPAAGRPGFTLGENEMELGLGIHGEPGVRRVPIEPADALVDRLVSAILDDARLAAGAHVVLMVNNLGATPTMELAIVARRAVTDLESRDLRVERVYLGTFLSALEMAGVSLSVLPVDDERLARLDAPTDAPAWPNAAAKSRRRLAQGSVPPAPTVEAVAHRPPTTQVGQTLGKALQAAATALIAASPQLTELDQAVGDGDLGISLERGARAVLDALPRYPLDDPAGTLHALGVTLQRALGGTSGPLYAAFFIRAAGTLRRERADDPAVWAEAFRTACEAISELGGARRGDRTMLDALYPAAEALSDAVKASQSPADGLRAAANAAAQGAQATVGMAPRRGRSSYLGERAVGHPDPGAKAVAIWLTAIASL